MFCFSWELGEEGEEIRVYGSCWGEGKWKLKTGFGW
jgi:hypothetical protein